MLTLEKYHGSGSRHTCPGCATKRKFTRYIDTQTGHYLADNLGRCDRESSCGYHYTPKQYFADNPLSTNVRKMSVFRRISKPGSINKNGSQSDYEGRFSSGKPDLIENWYLLETLMNYERNAFVQFLLGLFPNDPGDVWQAVSEYLIGTGRTGKTIFWQVDQTRRIRTGKTIQYRAETGKRRKDIKPNWIHAVLKKAGLLKTDFELRQCFFGEHLLRSNSILPIAITEAEKSAVVASICKGVFPEMVWLASGGKSNLNTERLALLGRNRTIILYPDADGFEKWQTIASNARKLGMTVNVSDLIENRATDDEKANGADLADYLTRLQMQRNDPATGNAFRDLIEERLAIMTIDGGLTIEQAESEIVTSGFYQDAIRSILQSA